MNSNEILELVEVIANTNGRNDKIALLKEFGEESQFRRVLDYAYNPFKTFGVLNAGLNYGERGVFTENTYTMLDNLANRKLSGNAARTAIRVEMEHLSKDSASLLLRILKKDLRAGFNEESINKAIKGLIPVMPYMRCSLPKDVKMHEIDWSKGHFSQLKADGSYANVSREKENVRIVTRQGQEYDYTVIDSLVHDFLNMLDEGWVYHGELLVFKLNRQLSRKEGNGVLNSVRQGGQLPAGHWIKFQIWDMVPLLSWKPKGTCYTPYADRYNMLTSMLETKPSVKSVEIIPTKVVYSLKEAQQHFAEVRALGLEGTVIKLRDGVWKDHTSKHQIKLKAENTCELRVVAMVPGTGKNEATFGSLLCQTEDGDLETNVAGFTDKERQEIFDNWSDWAGAVIGVTFNEVIESDTSDKLSLFLPRFDERRHDKVKADTTERVIAIAA